MVMANRMQRILIVDDEPNNLKVLQQILKKQYQLVFAKDGVKALAATAKHKPDLILLDIMMPDMDGYEVCRKLKANRLTADIPVIFVTALSEVAEESKGFACGGVDYITKPVSGPIVRARVKTHLALYDQQRICNQTVAERTAELELSHRTAIDMLGEAGHYNDADTGVHVWRMAAYSRAIAEAADWSVGDAERLELAAPMHDTGKIGTPDAILKKPGKLDAEEWVIMKKHTTIGYGILSKSKCPLFILAAEIALYHHEKWDGSGYPDALTGEDIPLSARIVALADVFDALTMRRPYKEAWPIEQAFAEIKKSSGTHFDPDLVDLFFSIEEKIRSLKQHWDKKEVENRMEPLQN